MELKKYKRMRNLPQYKEGFDYGGTALNAIQFGTSVYNSFSAPKSMNEIIAESGYGVGSGSGFTYNKLNNVDTSAQMSELNAQNTNNTLSAMGTGASLGGSIGMAFGPVGAGIGAVAGGLIGGITGLFGSSSRKRRLKRRIEAAQEGIRRTNNYNLASAQTDYLQNQFELDHGNTQDGELYIADKGKDLIRPKRIRR